jgi:ABC-2 type transport system permease protein
MYSSSSPATGSVIRDSALGTRHSAVRFPLLRGLLKLSWVEAKVFSREPGGFVVTLIMPAVMFIILGRSFGVGRLNEIDPSATPFNSAVFAAIVIAINAVQSLLQIIAIYREGGILKRLRATPLSPVAILGAHVIVKLGFALASMLVMVLAGRRFLTGDLHVHIPSFGIGVLLSTLSILSVGFVLASVVPTSRFAQMIGALVLYPMLAISGLFIALDRLPMWLRVVGEFMPTTHAAALLQGIWDHIAWAHLWPHAGALVLLFFAYTALSTRLFRWE